MPHFSKPAEGSWTEHYALGTGLISYEDSISPAHFELEREAIFKRTWLNVGRVEQLPKVGSYFTKEIDAARTSVVVVRDGAGGVRAFHNICRHRGNKLVWNDYPREETSGTCRQFTCKYHGWRYSLDGELKFVQQEGEFFELDKSQLGLVPVRCDVWAGFIFVNFDDADTTPLRDYLGKLAAGIEDYPFHEMTTVYKYRADVGSNWKLYIDAFAEFYHAPVLHAKQYVGDESSKLMGHGFEGLHYDIDGPHGMVSTWGGMAPPKDIKHGEAHRAGPAQRQLRSVGPPRHPRAESAAAGLQSVSSPRMGRRLVRLLPELHDPGLGAGLVHHVPLLADRLQPTHLRGHAVLRSREDRSRSHASGAGRGHLQGVRTAGLQHARGHPDHARVARGLSLPALRPGDPAPAPPQDGGRVRGRVRDQRDAPHVARGVRMASAAR